VPISSVVRSSREGEPLGQSRHAPPPLTDECRCGAASRAARAWRPGSAALAAGAATSGSCSALSMKDRARDGCDGLSLRPLRRTSETVQVVRQMDRGSRHSGGSFPLGKGFTSEVIRPVRLGSSADGPPRDPPVRLLYGTEAGTWSHPSQASWSRSCPAIGVLGVLSAQSIDPKPRRCGSPQPERHRRAKRVSRSSACA